MTIDVDIRDGFWVFGYGSLMWNPEFPVARQEIARLDGWHRSFCMWSIHHRGTEKAPGLVLALDAAEGAFCDGMAFQVAPNDAKATLAELRERELISSAYLETMQKVTLRSGTVIEAVTYVIDREHTQYCGGMALEKQAEILATAHGGRGPNYEYLYSSADHLEELGLADRDLSWLAKEVRARRG